MNNFSHSGFYDIFYATEKHRVWIEDEDEYYEMTNNSSIIKIKYVRCSGCIFDSLAQRDHTECPDGCLHNLLECSGCKK